jgi:hypothetical protein
MGKIIRLTRAAVLGKVKYQTELVGNELGSRVWLAQQL